MQLRHGQWFDEPNKDKDNPPDSLDFAPYIQRLTEDPQQAEVLSDISKELEGLSTEALKRKQVEFIQDGDGPANVLAQAILNAREARYTPPAPPPLPDEDKEFYEGQLASYQSAHDALPEDHEQRDFYASLIEETKGILKPEAS